MQTSELWVAPELGRATVGAGQLPAVRTRKGKKKEVRTFTLTGMMKIRTLGRHSEFFRRCFAPLYPP